jgi:hypothetical protein
VVTRARAARAKVGLQRSQATRDLALAYCDAAYSSESGVGIRPLARELGLHAPALHRFIHRNLDPEVESRLPRLSNDRHHSQISTPEQRASVSAALAARRQAAARAEARRLLVQRACQRAIDAGIGKVRLATELGTTYITLRGILEAQAPEHSAPGEQTVALAA